MDAWHRVGRIVRLSNLGTLIFFLLNIGLLFVVFCPSGVTWDTGLALSIGYILSVLISLSPVGEWVLAALSGAREIERKDIKVRLIPLLEITFENLLKEIFEHYHLSMSINQYVLVGSTIKSYLTYLCKQEKMEYFIHNNQLLFKTKK